MATEGASSLYERLGGVYSIATVIVDFIDRIMVDPRLNANPRVDEAHHRVPPAGFKYLVTEIDLMDIWTNQIETTGWVHADLGWAGSLWMFAAPAADIRAMSVGGSCCIHCAIVRRRLAPPSSCRRSPGSDTRHEALLRYPGFSARHRRRLALRPVGTLFSSTVRRAPARAKKDSD
jgi:hypothetical protein